ncbi:D-alanine--D-alanine ligase [Longibacter salinarum]|uniref:D-alanine--D-alanine ligase n=1 Tax=Longibacter salinarum TaxID=1850348 RepID=A0A2A8D0K6_9BACT|nr:D-alanine--D-alanine ligase family protein [Longibacter salinarum]PEN14411.1 D-alanine--D-alanine ligase [Longibacter salinarum]
MSDTALTVGVVLGGVAPEHEVSIISALQAAAALDRSKYEPVPLYIAKDGMWYTGDHLLDVEAYRDIDELRETAIPLALFPGPHGTLECVEVRDGGALSHLTRPPRRFSIDVVLPGLHGGAGENGGVQGLCETFNVPYTGSGIFGSAIGMDKVLSKHLCQEVGIPVVDFVAFYEHEWAHREEDGLDRCEKEVGYPAIVKPARGGSSIGIMRAEDREQLDAAIEDAFRYDDKVVVERAVQELREINCSLLGDGTHVEPSVLEEPVASDDDEVLTFQDKYMREDDGGVKGGDKVDGPGPEGMASLDRIIPADLSDERTQEIQDLAIRIFRLFECAGVARIDFMIDEATDELFFNEINTIPGSFSFYLWDPSGVPFDELMDRMIQIARKQHREKNGRVRTYDVNLLAERSLSGLKGAKGE